MSDKLTGEALAEALESRKLSTEGTADERRARVEEYDKAEADKAEADKAETDKAETDDRSGDDKSSDEDEVRKPENREEVKPGESPSPGATATQVDPNAPEADEDGKSVGDELAEENPGPDESAADAGAPEEARERLIDSHSGLPVNLEGSHGPVYVQGVEYLAATDIGEVAASQATTTEGESVDA